ncbi:GNAT family N-acetyltransferase [Rhodobacteraceae bacterium nBUS_24]
MIYAGVWDDNPASLSVLAKCGMKQIGTARYWSRARSAPVTSCEHVLTRSEWLLNNPIRIDTPRVVLRGLNADHVTDIARIGGDEKVAPMIMRSTVPWPVHDAAAWGYSKWMGCSLDVLALGRIKALCIFLILAIGGRAMPPKPYGHF